MPKFCLWWTTLSLLALTLTTAWAQDMTIQADATRIQQKLLKTVTTYPAQAGELRLLYPEWIPGIHGPRGPLQNLAEIRVEDDQGHRLPWRRDPHDAYRFLVEVPEDAAHIVVHLTYICNQPSTNSRSIDSYGTSLLGVIDWNTCLLYPEGKDIGQIQTKTTLILPGNWKWGSSLKPATQKDHQVQFEKVSFRELVDSPVIMGEYFRTIDLTPESGPPHYLHLVGETEHDLRPEERTVKQLKHLVVEGLALFDRAHFDEYHFLLVLSDAVPRIGLEHLKSSLNSVGDNGLTDEEAIESTGVLLAHEYGHSWCGKYRRPAGMITPDYNTPKDTRLLWVYEGLDTYLGEVLAARCGIIAKKKETPFKQALIRLAKSTHRHLAQKGRRTIDLQDTAASAYLRRGGSDHWRYLNRSQDYYSEGYMLWIHADALIRNNTDGEKSLDDFLRAFLGHHVDGQQIVGFDEEEIIRRLNEVVEHDWAALIRKYAKDWQQTLPLDFLTQAGYRIQYSNKKTDYDNDMIFTSLGLNTTGSGTVQSVVPGSPSAEAGLYDDVQIIGVNNKKFSQTRLKDAIENSVANPEIKLLLLKDESFQTVTLSYDQGPRYLDLVRNPQKTDRLQELFEPLRKTP